MVAQLAHLAKFAGGLPPLSAVPALGEHSEQVLSDFLGYGQDRIARLREAGVIFQG
jgi:crotonobetainyl-CoA:carnitine CoA-transferase CaiB-like acyl-CoA transferase